MTTATTATTLTASTACPCGSGQTYGACCQPLHQGKKKAETAEALLRSRYCAFVANEVDYILDTHHSKTRKEVNREEIATWAKDSTWLGLEILDKAGGEAKDEKAEIIFHARYEANGKAQDHYEKSFFEKEKGEWRFVDAHGIQTGPYVRQEPKVGRNDPCTCGSGKKYKKCCGVAA